MKKMTYSFRSIKVENVEKPVLGTGYTRMAMEFEMESVMNHRMELGLLDILGDRTWKMNLFLAVMVVSAIFALLYGLLRVAFHMDFSSPEGLMERNIFILLMCCSLLLTWLAFSLRFGIANKKKETVEEARGKGNWKIIDESDWNQFYRLWKLARDNEEKERENFKNKLYTKDS